MPFYIGSRFNQFIANHIFMKSRIFIPAAVALLLASCAKNENSDYTVTVNVPSAENGSMAYLVDYDSSDKIDSTIVENGTALFKGKIAKAVMAQVVCDGSRAGTIVLEPGQIVLDSETRAMSGSPLNESLASFNKAEKALMEEYRQLPDDSTGMARAKELSDRHTAMSDSLIAANNDNALGYYTFLQSAYECNLPQLDSILALYPTFSEGKRIAKLRTSLVKKQETQPGNMFKDFEVTYDGKTSRLSDYVGKGKYTLVDFWASWCGPCIRETAVIKELYNKYSDKGLEVLGVAVWDQPENTLKAIEQHQLPWNQILDAQTIPTDIYGISSIPCIILFDPQGKIVSRDKQDAELTADVDAAMANIGLSMD